MAAESCPCTPLRICMDFPGMSHGTFVAEKQNSHNRLHRGVLGQGNSPRAHCAEAFRSLVPAELVLDSSATSQLVEGELFTGMPGCFPRYGVLCDVIENAYEEVLVSRTSRNDPILG